MTKTKHALPFQRKGPPLPSLPSPSTGVRMLLLESSIVFSHKSPSPGWMSVALVGARTREFPDVPTAPGHVLRARMVPSGCPAWLVLPVNVDLWRPPPWFHHSSCGPSHLPRQESIWRDGGSLFHHLGVVWLFSLSPPTSFSTKES